MEGSRIPKPPALQVVTNTALNQSGPDSAMKRKSPDAMPQGARAPLAKKAALVNSTAPSQKPLKDRPPTWEEHCEADPSLDLESILKRKITGKGSFDTKGKLEDAIKILTLLRAALVYMRDQVAERESERQSLEDKIQRMANDMHEMERKAAAEKDDNARTLVHAQSQIRKLTEEQLRTANDRKRLEQELKSKDEELRALRDQTTRVTLELEHAQRVIEAEQERTRQAESNLQKSQEYVGHLQQFNTQLQQQVNQLQEVAGAHQGEKHELLQRNADLQGQVQAAQHQLEALKSTAMDADSVRRAAEAEISRLKQEIDTAVRARTAMNEEVSADRARLSARVTELESMLNMAAMYKEEAERKRDEAVARVQAFEARMEQWKNEAEQAVNAARSEASAAVQQLQSAQGQLSAQSSELQQLRSGLQQQQADLQQKATDLERVRADRGKFAAQCQAQEERLRQLSGDLEQLRMHNAALQDSAGNRTGEVSKLIDHNKMLEQRMAEMERMLREAEVERKRLHNQVQELKGNIRVYCRIRPMAPQEAAASNGATAVQPAQVGINKERRVDLQVPNAQDASKAPARSSYNFDRVFGPTDGQEAVFEEISQLVQSSLDGYNVCIFAYGQTGSGKTHTMIGTSEAPGMIPRSLQMIFEKGMQMATQGWTFQLGASMLEIYNEQMRDLLAPQSNAELKINLDGSVTNLTVAPVVAPDQAQQLIHEAFNQRTVGATLMNERSSRSHCVFQLRIQATHAATGQTTAGMLNLIDLAGSERLKQSGATGDRKTETAAINSSLSYLKDVMLAIKNKAAHVPFRNSILTRLLEPSMKGDAKVLMFVNVSPALESAAETQSSLRFAATVNECQPGGGAKKPVAATGSVNDENSGPVNGVGAAAGGAAAGGARRPATAGPGGFGGGAKRL